MSAGSQDVFTVSVDEVATVCCQGTNSPISESEFKLVIDDVQRLGLVRMDTKVFVRGTWPNLPRYNLPTYLQHAYYMTDYAINFVRACRAPANKSG
jgi:hypothetical protein